MTTIPLFKVRMAIDAHVRVGKVLHSGNIAQGPVVDEFEAALAKLMMAPHEILTLNSATSALDLALQLAGVNPGDEVITTAMTCVATNIGIVHRGAIPVWADVDPFTGLINPADVLRMISPARHRRAGRGPTKAIIAVDWAGVPCDYTALKEFDLPVIEDAAHALLAHRNGRPLPYSGGDFVTWSFQAIKHLTTGDGGALLAPTDQIERARKLRWYGLDRRSKVDFRAGQDIPEMGHKYHMNDVAAAIGLANLPGAQDAVDRHRACAATYYKELNDLHPHVQLAPWVDGASYWIYTLLVSDRPSFEAYMAERGIQVSQVHARNDRLSSLCAFAPQRELPGLDYFSAHQVSIPCGWWLTEHDVNQIIEAVRGWAHR